jgi:hypothetical protein
MCTNEKKACGGAEKKIGREWEVWEMMGEKKYEKKFAPYIQIYIERVMHQRDGVRNRKVEKYKRTVWRIIHSAERGQHHNRSDFFFIFWLPSISPSSI